MPPDSDLRQQVLESWRAFARGLHGPDPLRPWAPEIRAIESNRLRWWRYLLEGGGGAIGPCHVLTPPCAGVFVLRTGVGASEVGFVKRKGDLWLTSAKSVRLLARVRDWPRVEGDHFEFACCDMGRVTNRVIKRAEELHRRLRCCLAIGVSARPVRDGKIRYVACCDSQAIESLTGLTLGPGSSLTDPVTLTVVSTRLPDEHEIAHAVAAQYLAGAPPVAYREGLAECFRRPVAWGEFLRDPTREPSVFDDLRAAAFFRAPAPWAQAGAFCKYIARSFGVEPLNAIHRAATARTFHDRVREITGHSTDELVAASRKVAREEPAALEACEHLGRRAGVG